MMSLSLILGSIALFGGFLALTAYEKTRGLRFYSEQRLWLDRRVEQINFIIEHVDFAAFVRDELQRIVRTGAHMLVHGTLQSVRALERALTHLVRRFRVPHEQYVPRSSARVFVKTLSDFKEQLRATAPEVSEVR